MNPVYSSLSTYSSSSSKRERDPNSVDGPPICKRPKLKYDLFVNYLYEDIGKSFISHVHGALHRNGFTISGHTKVPPGHEVCSERLKAIEESEIFLLVFSINYASSVRCLDELVDIMDCKDKFDQKKVFPVFFNVDPRDVRKQEGPFKEAFEAHTTNFDHHRVQKWRKALNDAGQLSGEHYINGDEESFICKIIKKLQSMQNPQELYVADHAVGIESRVDKLLSILRLDLEDVLVVAVLGIGGIGKTTIVKAMYNRIAAEFDASCFLEDIHYQCESPTLKVEMQKRLIYSLLKKFQYDNNLPMIHHHSQGISTIRSLTKGRKLLLVLDNLTHVNQLEAVGISPFKTSFLNECFGGGSRIIVTTRDKRSLGSLSYVSYNTPLLNMEESIELLTRLMYEKNDPPIDRKFLEQTARCASGLPLVLEIWSLHFRQYEREEWPNVLKSLKAIPHDDIHKKLRISYDALTKRAKKVFLDIACFFNEMDKNIVVKVLQDEELGFFPDHEIQCLIDRGLVTIGSRFDNEVQLAHDAIIEMGQEIVRQENEDEPGQRTRLKKREDVRRVLEEFSGTRSVESIHLHDTTVMTVDIEAFRKMENLRLISVNNLAFCSVPINLLLGCDSDKGVPPPLSFPKLKYLEWQSFPMESINIDMCNVVVIQLIYSHLKTLWKGSKDMKKLKILDVRNSPLLTNTGSFIGVKNLEHLHMNGCSKLEELDSSVCCLGKLVTLKLSDCEQLKMFPSEMIGNLQSLDVLALEGCAGIGFEQDEVIKLFMSSLKETRITFLSLDNCKIYKVPSEVGSLTWLKTLYLKGNYFHSLPDTLCQLDRLETIDLTGCQSLQSIPDLPRSVCSVRARDCHSLTILPSNMSELTCLKMLDLTGCSKLGMEDSAECLLKLTGLTSLIDLDMQDCNISHVPTGFGGSLVSLQTLDLSGNTFSSLPDSFSNLLQLRYLSISNCSELTSLPLLPPFLKYIEATGCLSLDVMRPASVVLMDDNFYCCPIPPSRDYSYEFSKCVLAAYKEASFLSGLQIVLSEDEVPKWCHYIVRQQQGKFFMPPQLHLDMKIFGMILCINLRHFNLNIVVELQNKTKGTTYFQATSNTSGTMCLLFVPLENTTLMVEAGDEVAIDIQARDNGISGYGLCLIYKGEGENDEMGPTTNHVNQTT